MQAVRFWLFGGFRAASRAGELSRPGSHKAQELLALLLLSREDAMARDVAAEHLWPATDPATSRKAMRQALWHAHQTFDTSDHVDERLVVSDDEHLRINGQRRIWVDVDAYRRAVTRSEGVAANRLDDADLASLADAADLYRRPLLDGWYEDWCLIERERLADLHLTVLDKLSVAHELRGEHELAAKWARELLVHEPAHERTHRRLMRLYYLTDERSRALRQYARCRAVLEDELGVKPAARTESLAETIRADDGRIDGTGPDRTGPDGTAQDGTGPDGTGQPVVDIADEIVALREEFALLRDELRGQRATR